MSGATETIERRLVIGSLFFFAVWLFVALPIWTQWSYNYPINPSNHHPGQKAEYTPQHEVSSKSPAVGPPEHHDGHQNYEPKSEFWSIKVSDFVLALFSGLLTFFTYRLWKSTDKLWLASERALTSLERAFVTYEFQTLGRQEGETIIRYEIMIGWKNIGRTPTRGLYQAVNWREFPCGIPDDFAFPDKDPPNQTFIAPQDAIDANPISIPVDLLMKVWGEKTKLYIWGWAEYDDVFEGTKPHRTEFFNEILVTRDPRIRAPENDKVIKFGICGRHVGIDDECYRKARPREHRSQPYQ